MLQSLLTRNLRVDRLSISVLLNRFVGNRVLGRYPLNFDVAARSSHSSPPILQNSKGDSSIQRADPPAVDPKALFKDQNDTWVDRYAPSWLHPYLKLSRVDRPIGTWLVLLPGWWGVALAAPAGGLPDPWLLALFGVGAFAMRGAGCTVNDMWDRRYDGKVARTSMRPLASGRIGMGRAFTWLALQGSLAFGVLTQFSLDTILIGAAAVPIVILYPAMKRLTHWPQAVLGCAMNYGILMGPPAAAGTHVLAKEVGLVDALTTTLPPSTLDMIGRVLVKAGEGIRGPTVTGGEGEATTTLSEALTLSFGSNAPLLTTILPLYAGAALWTIVYDTIYAHQDIKDDKRLGLKSTAILMGDSSKQILTGFALAAGVAWGAAGVGGDLGYPFLLATTAATTHLLWQTTTASYDGSDRENLSKRFISNQWVGWVIFLGIVVGKLLQKNKEKDEKKGIREEHEEGSH